MVGQPVTIAATLGMVDGTSVDAIYWDTTFYQSGVPLGAPVPGTLTPRSGGPIRSGETVVLTYVPTAPVNTVVNVWTSMNPVDTSASIPVDGNISDVLLHVK